MSQFAKMGEVVLDFAEVLAIFRELATDEKPGTIKIFMKGGHSFQAPEGSSSYASIAAWLRDTPEFGPEVRS